MSDAPLASVSQLGAYLQQTFDPGDVGALLVLQIAASLIRDHLQQEITQVLGDVVVLDPVEGTYVFLPELPVTAISKVEVYDTTVTPAVWTTADPSTYLASLATGVIQAAPYSGATWPSAPGSWRVTYDHGHAVVPDGIMGVCVSLAARIYATEDGIDLERIGGYQVKYQSDADGFSPLQIKAMARYVNPRIA
jgi:hypothetical protein